MDEIIKAIHQADEQGEPKAIFALVSEDIVWQYAQAILDDPEWGDLLGPVLLEAIGEANIKNPETAYRILQLGLNSSYDSLVYKAAQLSVLRLCNGFEAKTAKKFFSTFEDGYLETVDDGDTYIALTALEGAVMLPIYRRDKSLLYKAIGLLLNHFPPISDDAYESADLPVKALKLIGRCYDMKPALELAEQVEAMIYSNNVSVKAEANFNLGLIKLYDVFQATDSQNIQDNLSQAYNLFEASYNLEENRTDAKLFLAITQCYLVLQSPGALPKISEYDRNQS